MQPSSWGKQRIFVYMADAEKSGAAAHEVKRALLLEEQGTRAKTRMLDDSPLVWSWGLDWTRMVRCPVQSKVYMRHSAVYAWRQGTCGLLSYLGVADDTHKPTGEAFHKTAAVASLPLKERAPQHYFLISLSNAQRYLCIHVYQRYRLRVKNEVQRRSMSGSPKHRNLCALCFRALVSYLYGLAPNAPVLLARPSDQGWYLLHSVSTESSANPGCPTRLCPGLVDAMCGGSLAGELRQGARCVQERENIAVVLLDAKTALRRRHTRL